MMIAMAETRYISNGYISVIEGADDEGKKRGRGRGKGIKMKMRKRMWTKK